MAALIMIKQYLIENFLSLKFIRRKLSLLKFDIKALFIHIYNNKRKLPFLLGSYKKLHFGSGVDIKKGFINIDLNGGADIFLDVRNKLNIQDNIIEYIYSSHFVEHLEHEELVFHLKECHRILKPGMTLRLGVPDFEMVFRNYINRDQGFLLQRTENLSKKLDLPIESICYMDVINKTVYEFGQHKICIDYEKIFKLLEFSGFDNDKIVKMDFDERIDVESRKELTFYVEATK